LAQLAVIACALGVETFGQTGSILELYQHYGINAIAIVAGLNPWTPGAPMRCTSE
jgi:pyruvate dehydrogenase E1 component